MVSFHPFSPLRPIHGKESEIAAPPYDVVDRKEARAFVQDKPNSLLRIILSLVDFCSLQITSNGP